MKQLYTLSPNIPVPVRWSSPETLDRKKYSRASDVYMFGATLLELVTREDPFEGQPSLFHG